MRISENGRGGAKIRGTVFSVPAAGGLGAGWIPPNSRWLLVGDFENVARPPCGMGFDLSSGVPCFSE